jgi:F0F1-type ATP synthase delta subunit
MKSKKIVVFSVKTLAANLSELDLTGQTRLLERLRDFLAHQKKEYLLPKILEDTKKILARREQIDIILAHEQNRAAAETIEKKLRARFGKEKQVKVAVDPGLIGGFIAKTDNYLVNASVRDYLNQLKHVYGQN